MGAGVFNLMRTIWLALLFALPIAAQTVNPNQIRPSSTNGKTLATYGCSGACATEWLDPGSINVLAQGVLNNGTLGTPASTDTANTAAIQAAINLAESTHAQLYFPCGVYNVNGPLTVYGYQSISIIGETHGCVQIQFTGTSPITPGMLTVTGIAPATPCTSQACLNQPAYGSTGFEMKDIALVGNVNVPDALDLLSDTFFHLDHVVLIGAEYTSLYCNSCQQGQIDVIQTSNNALFGVGGYVAYQTPDGLVFDNQANQIAVNSPITDGMAGHSIWLKGGAGGVRFINCQNSSSLYGITIDASEGNVFEDCMNESAGVPGSYSPMNLSSSANNNTFIGSGLTANTTIYGNGNTFIGGALGTLTIESGAHANTIDSVSMLTSTITDNATDTQYRSIFNPATGTVSNNFPGWQYVTPPIGGGCTGVLHLQGSWSTSGTAQALSPTALCGINGWRAVFKGYWTGPGGYQSLAQSYEFTSTAPTASLNTGTVTIAASNGSQLTMATTGAGTAVYFRGSVDFYPYAGGSSASFANGILAPSIGVALGPYITYSSNNLFLSSSNDGTGLVDGEMTLEAGGNLTLLSGPTSITNASTVALANASTNAASHVVIGNSGGAGIQITDVGAAGIILTAPTGGITAASAVKMTAITGHGSKGPVCTDASGNLYVGNNTGSGAPCP